MKGAPMVIRCRHPECDTVLSLGTKTRRTKTRRMCVEHDVDEGWRLGFVVEKKCGGRLGCESHPSYGMKGTNTPVMCLQHAKAGMVKRCAQPFCDTVPSYMVAGTRTRVACAQHAKTGMVNEVGQKRCGYPSCDTHPSYGMKGTKKRLMCLRHAEPGMVKRCRQPFCDTVPSYMVAGTRTRVACTQHAKRGMVNVLGKRCRHPRCRKMPSYAVQGTRTAVACAEHAVGGMVRNNKIITKPVMIKSVIKTELEPTPEPFMGLLGSSREKKWKWARADDGAMETEP